MELETDCLDKLIKKIKQCEGTDTDLAECTKNVYGRIVAEGEGSLQYLSSSKNRKTVFLFGEDAITSLVLRKSPYDSLIELGFTPEYIHYKVIKVLLGLEFTTFSQNNCKNLY